MTNLGMKTSSQLNSQSCGTTRVVRGACGHLQLLVHLDSSRPVTNPGMETSSELNSQYPNGNCDFSLMDIPFPAEQQIVSCSEKKPQITLTIPHMDFPEDQQKVKLEEKKLIMGEQEKQIRYAETKAGQIVVSYILFVSIMYCSISWSSSSFVFRRVRWILFSQILMISGIFWLVITKVIQRLLRAKYHYEESLIELEMDYEDMYMVQSGQRNSREQQQTRGTRLVMPDPGTQRQWKTYVFAIVSPLLAFSVLTLYACVKILR